MKTLADLRAAMAVGVVVQVTNHRYPELSGERTVIKVQTKRWFLTLPESHPRHGEVEGSWMDIPPANRCAFDGNSVTITREPEWNDPGPWVTLTFNQDGR